MKKGKPPSKIYLQIGSDLDVTPFYERKGVTWYSEKINENDLEYIQIDEYNKLKEASENVLKRLLLQIGLK